MIDFFLHSFNNFYSFFLILLDLRILRCLGWKQDKKHFWKQLSLCMEYICSHSFALGKVSVRSSVSCGTALRRTLKEWRPSWNGCPSLPACFPKTCVNSPAGPKGRDTTWCSHSGWGSHRYLTTLHMISYCSMKCSQKCYEQTLVNRS